VTTRKTSAKKAGASSESRSKAQGPATVASILGSTVVKPGAPPVRGQVRAEWEKYYYNLIDLRDRLTSQISGLAKESAEEISGYSLHMADSGTDNFDRDFALSLLSADQDAVYEIDEALKRIQKGTFGICELTGKVIPKARLEAIPWTRFNVEAQAQLEREGALRQRRLGALGTVDNVGATEVEEEDEVEERSAKEKE
jgi:RNA polymerase-binding transcription factor DksA